MSDENSEPIRKKEEQPTPPEKTAPENTAETKNEEPPFPANRFLLETYNAEYQDAKTDESDGPKE